MCGEWNGSPTSLAVPHAVRKRGWGKIDPDPIQRGHAFEDAILQWVRRKTGLDCREWAMLQDPSSRFRFATPDFVIYHPYEKPASWGAGRSSAASTSSTARARRWWRGSTSGSR